jgi:hypothetical protein
MTTAVALVGLALPAMAGDRYRNYSYNRDGWNNSYSRNAQRYRGLDRNRDGAIERYEWRGNNRSFERLDRNHDGVISRSDRYTDQRYRERNRGYYTPYGYRYR